MAQLHTTTIISQLLLAEERSTKSVNTRSPARKQHRVKAFKGTVLWVTCKILKQIITSSNLLTSLDKRFTICPVVVLANALLLRQRAFAEQRCEIKSYKPQEHDRRMKWTHRCLLMTDLPINHVAHGYANLHADSLYIVEIEMMKDSQGNGGQRDACSIAVGLIDCSCIGGVITLKVLNYLPK